MTCSSQKAAFRGKNSQSASYFQAHAPFRLIKRADQFNPEYIRSIWVWEFPFVHLFLFCGNCDLGIVCQFYTLHPDNLALPLDDRPLGACGAGHFQPLENLFDFARAAGVAEGDAIPWAPVPDNRRGSRLGRS